eukprot:1795088-Amphidinium_carterae.1
MERAPDIIQSMIAMGSLHMHSFGTTTPSSLAKSVGANYYSSHPRPKGSQTMYQRAHLKQAYH